MSGSLCVLISNSPENHPNYPSFKAFKFSFLCFGKGPSLTTIHNNRSYDCVVPISGVWHVLVTCPDYSLAKCKCAPSATGLDFFRNIVFCCYLGCQIFEIVNPLEIKQLSYSGRPNLYVIALKHAYILIYFR